MSTQQILDYSSNIYLTVTLSSSSPFFSNPSALAVRPSLTHIGSVGQLPDVQILSVPKGSWGDVRGEVLSALDSLEGVLRVDVQDPPRLRAKRGGDEL